MNLAIKKLLVVMGCSMVATSASAQMWGTGMYGAMQSCPYNYSAGAGSSSYIDEIRENQKLLNAAERQLKDKKRQQDKLQRVLDRARADVENTIDADFASFLFDHVQYRRDCTAYAGIGDPGSEDGVPCENGDGCAQDAPGSIDIYAYKTEEWSRICDSNRMGRVNAGAACNTRRSRIDGGDAGACTEGLQVYQNEYSKFSKLEREISALEREVESYQEAIDYAKQDYIDEMEEKQTQGGICWDCITGSGSYTYERPQTDWPSVTANLVTGALGVYMGYKTNKMVSQNNAALGWPTQPYPAIGYGLPYLAAGVYGALGGGIGQGGFGCGAGTGGTGFGNGPMGMMGPFGMGSMYPGMGGNGMMGYPGGMMGSPMGGGMYMPGMGPWGMAGPWGMGGPYPGAMGMPMSGMMASGGIMMPGGMMMPGMAMGGGGYPMMGGMMGGGMPMSGMMASGGIMMPGGMMMPGMAMGGGGYPMMGGMMGGGMPMSGMMASGGMMMPGMAMGGGGYPMMGGGMPMSGMMASGGMMMPGMAMGGGGYPMMGGMMGGMMNGMDMTGMSMQNMQYQQQMMQMQMQQYQVYMQMQQRAQENFMQKQQAVVGIQQEIQSLMVRLQMVQSGMYSGGFGAGGGVSIGIGGGFGGGFGGGGFNPTLPSFPTTPGVSPTQPVNGVPGR